MKQPEFSDEKKKTKKPPRFLRKFPSSFHGGGAGVRGGGGRARREGSDTSAVGFAPHQHGLGCREKRGAIPTAGRARHRTTSLHRSPAGTTQGLLHAKMLSRPSSSHTPPNRCRLPRLPLIPGPAALRAWTGAGKSGTGLRAPKGSLGVVAGGDATTEVPVILKIPVP